jgi:hypothetical protein
VTGERQSRPGHQEPLATGGLLERAAAPLKLAEIERSTKARELLLPEDIGTQVTRQFNGAA